MTPAEARASYRRQIAQHGETVIIRRLSPDAAPVDLTVRARVLGYKPEDMTGSVRQGDRRIIALAEDFEGTSWPSPPRDKDQILIRGAPTRIEAVDDNTRRIAGVLIAYEIQVRG